MYDKTYQYTSYHTFSILEYKNILAYFFEALHHGEHEECREDAEHGEDSPYNPQRQVAPKDTAHMATRKLPMAVATNHPPIIIPLYFGGATFDTNEIPIGESRSSANVKIRYVPISQLADATGPSCPLSARAFCSFGVSSPCEAIIITKKATAATNIP